MTALTAALDRGDRFEKELKAVDAATGAQLIGAWKESLLERITDVLRATSDPKDLAFLDRDIAVVEEILSARKSV